MLFGAARNMPQADQHEKERDRDILHLIATGSVPVTVTWGKHYQRAVENALWILDQSSAFSEGEIALAQDDLRRVAAMLCEQRPEMHEADLQYLSCIAQKYAQVANQCHNPFHSKQIDAIANRLQNVVDGGDCSIHRPAKSKKPTKWYARLWRNTP